MSFSTSSTPSVTRAVQFRNGALTVTFSPLIATDVEIVMNPHHDVIQNLTTMVTSSYIALRDNFGTNFSSAVFSTLPNVVSSDISPICSFALPQSLPSLSSLIFPSLPLPPRSSLTPTESEWTDQTLAQPYVSDPADVKLQRSMSLAADRSLQSSTPRSTCRTTSTSSS